MRKYKTRILARKLINVESEKQTLYDLEIADKTDKSCKIRNTYCRTCNMSRNTEICEI